jgi:hypothetical protein
MKNDGEGLKGGKGIIACDEPDIVAGVGMTSFAIFDAELLAVCLACSYCTASKSRREGRVVCSVVWLEY